ncbi:hypothetical protein JS562_51435, partial [Agrobacterium sp. S2]|nr:hypothetical protein [Agrobacterium sp. S2]
MLEAAGVDPADAPGSITELFETATAVHDATGTAGLTMFLDPWWSEQFTASEGLEYCTPENGVGAEPADAFQYTTDAQVGLWEHLQRLVQDGSNAQHRHRRQRVPHRVRRRGGRDHGAVVADLRGTPSGPPRSTSASGRSR